MNDSNIRADIVDYNTDELELLEIDIGNQYGKHTESIVESSYIVSETIESDDQEAERLKQFNFNDNLVEIQHYIFEAIRYQNVD